MFTGLVKDVGEVVALEKADGHVALFIRTALDLSGTETGASISCSGCCLTATDIQDDRFRVVVSNESLSKTNIGAWEVGTKVNLEPSLKAGDELGGHLVSGHVDGLAVVTEIKPDGDSYRLALEVPEALAKFIAPKGSVTLDGISLTVNNVQGSRFDVNIIPHTWQVTNLSGYGAGGRLNMEVDIIARYVARLLGKA
jgi:riboflavin synthase